MAVRVITQLGDPVLLEAAVSVDDPGGREARQIAEDLLDTMRENRCTGLAAPQIGVSRRVIVVKCAPNPKYPDAPTIEPFAMVNPEILSASEETVLGWEGCCSIPGIWGIIRRNKSITVRYVDAANRTVIAEHSGVPARIIRHEIDHLDGKVILDRVESTAYLYTQREMLKRSAPTDD